MATRFIGACGVVLFLMSAASCHSPTCTVECEQIDSNPNDDNNTLEANANCSCYSNSSIPEYYYYDLWCTTGSNDFISYNCSICDDFIDFMSMYVNESDHIDCTEITLTLVKSATTLIAIEPTASQSTTLSLTNKATTITNTPDGTMASQIPPTTVLLSIETTVSQSTTSSLTNRATTTDEITNTPDVPLTTTATMPKKSIVMILWIVLACLAVLITVLLILICCIAAATCKQRYKGKKPGSMDIISKWEDKPTESSDIQLVSVKSIAHEEGEKQGDGVKVEGDTEVTNEAKEDEASDKGEKKGEKKGDEITLGTFGFPDVAVEPTASKADITEKKDTPADNGQPVEKREQTDKSPEEDKVKSEQPSKSDSDKHSASASECTIPKDKQVEIDRTTNTNNEAAVKYIMDQEETKAKPVPVDIPVFDKQVKEGTSNSDSLKKANEEASPSLLSKEQASACGSSCSIKEVTNTDEVSKGTETAATDPQPSVKPGSISDKTSTATGPPPPSLLSNDDIEKALGVSVKGVGQEESTHL